MTEQDDYLRAAKGRRRREHQPADPEPEAKPQAPLITAGARSRSAPRPTPQSPDEAFRRAVDARRGTGGWHPVV